MLGESELLLAEADEDSAAEEVAVEDGEVLGEAAGEAAEGGQQQGAHSGRVTVWRWTVEAINILRLTGIIHILTFILSTCSQVVKCRDC